MNSFIKIAVVTILPVLFVAHPGGASADIKIGIAGPMSGQYQKFGTQMTNGASQAIRDINAAGGVNGQKLELVRANDRCDANRAVAVAETMVRRGISLMAGHFCSEASIMASPVYENNEIIQISPSSTNPDLTDYGGPNVFRMAGRSDRQGVIAGEMLAREFPDRRVAIIHDETAYGTGLAEATKKAMNGAGKDEVLYRQIAAGRKSYAGLVADLKRENIEVLYLGGYHREAGRIARALRRQQLKTVLVSGDALATGDFWRTAGKAGLGTLFTFIAEPTTHPAAAKLVSKFKARGIDPTGYVLYTYAAIQVWAEAARAAGSIETADVIDTLRSQSFDTVLGNVRFDRNGDVNLPSYVWYIWKSGKFEQFGGR